MMDASGISRAVDAPTVARRAQAAVCIDSKIDSDIHDIWTSCAGLRTQRGLSCGGAMAYPLPWLTTQFQKPYSQTNGSH